MICFMWQSRFFLYFMWFLCKKQDISVWFCPDYYIFMKSLYNFVHVNCVHTILLYDFITQTGGGNVIPQGKMSGGELPREICPRGESPDTSGINSTPHVISNDTICFWFFPRSKNIDRLSTNFCQIWHVLRLPMYCYSSNRQFETNSTLQIAKNRSREKASKNRINFCATVAFSLGVISG